MKRIRILTTLIFTIVLLTGCSKEEVMESKEFATSGSQLYSKEKVFSKKTTLHELPAVKNLLNSKTNSMIFKGNGMGKKGARTYFDQENVLETFDSEGNASYSLHFFYENSNPDTFFNLIVVKEPDGSLQEPYIISYTANQESSRQVYGNPELERINFSQFSGSVKRYSFEQFFSESPLGKDCDNFDMYGDPIYCEELILVEGATGGGSGSGGDTPDNPDWDPYTGYSSNVSGTWNIYHLIPDGSGRIYRFGSGSQCMWNDQCDILIMHDSSNQDQKTSPNGCIDCEVQLANTVGINFETPVLKLDYWIGLNWTEKVLFSEQAEVAQQINFHMKHYGWNTASQQIARQIVNAFIDGNLMSINPFIRYPVTLADKYATDYPKLTEYLKNQLPLVAGIPKIVNAINEFTNISISQIETDLQWGEGPFLKIIQLDNYKPGETDSNTAGYFDKATPNALYIDVDFVNLIENETSNQASEDALLFWIGTTILHEYVHYGDFLNGFEYPGEEGRLFEVQVYGTNVMPDNARLILNRVN